MPQLDTTWFLSQTFWLCVSFFALYFVVSKFLAPQIAKILEERQNKIDGYLNQAQKLNTEAEKVFNKYEKDLQKAKADANANILKQQQDLATLIDNKTQEVNDKISKEIAKTQDFVANSKKTALDKIDEIASDLSKEIIKKLDI